MSLFGERRHRVWVLCLLAVVLIAELTSAAVAFDRGRSAMVDQVHQAEGQLADERSAELAATVELAVSQIGVRAATPGLADAVTQRDVALLMALMTGSARSGAALRVAVTAPDGDVIVAQPASAVVKAPKEGVAITAGPARRDALIRIRGPISDSHGVTVGEIHVELSVARLLPRLVDPPRLASGSVSLVTRDGTVVMTGSNDPTARIESSELLRAVASRQPALLSFHSASLDQDRLAAVSPVPGTTWAIVVGADRKIAYAPAERLARELVAVFLVVTLVVGGLMALIGLLLRSRSRALDADRVAARKLSEVDPLTGALNRRGLDRVLADAAADSERHALLLFDVDRFKVINDTCGHLAGDEVLCAIAASLGASVRASDSVVRLGGDEFVVVQPHADNTTAERTARRAQDAIGTIEVPGFGLVDVSVGWATGGPEESHDLLRRADRALYESKAARRQEQPLVVPQLEQT